MFAYKSQSGICLRLMREIKINARIKLIRLISIAGHPKIIENSIIGCGKYLGSVVYRNIMQTIKKMLQINANLNAKRSLLAFSFTGSGCGSSMFISSLSGSMSIKIGNSS